MNGTGYGIFWWHLDFISGERLWLDEQGNPMFFQDQRDALDYMHRLYQDPEFRKLGFRVAAL